MRINGEWLWCADGFVRPIIRAQFLRADGGVYPAPLLIDTGADQTVINANVFQAIGVPAVTPQARLAGAGGLMRTVGVDLTFTFARDDGQASLFHGRFAACLDPLSLDMCVLGRDLLDEFALILDWGRDVVAFLAGDHVYAISQRQ